MKKALIATIMLIALSVALPALAATNYEPLVALPEAAPAGGTNFVQYLAGMFKLLIWLTAFFAVIMIIYGGFQYLSTDSFSGKSEGKATITRALEGLLLAIVSWLILYTINPKLIEFNFSLQPAALSGTPSAGTGLPNTPGGGGTPGGTLGGARLTDAQARTALASAGIQVNAQPPQTSLNNINAATIGGVINLKQFCQDSGGGCSQLMVTGGTEGGHASGPTSHGAGYKVDISTQQLNGAQFDTFMQGQVKTQNGLTAVAPDTNYQITVGGVNYQVRYEPSTTHWDIAVL